MRVVLAVWVCAMMVTPLAAQRAQVRLTWTAAEQCIDGPTLSRRVEERLGRPVFVPSDVERTFVVRGDVQRGDRGWLAHLQLVDPSGDELGTRVLVGEGECTDLSRTIAIVVSLLVEQNADRIVLYEPEPDLEPEPEPDLEPPVTSAGPHAQSDEPDPVPPLRLTVWLDGSARTLVLPDTAFGLRQVVRLGLPGVPLAIGVEANFVPSYRVTSEFAAADVRAWSVGPTLCPELWSRTRARLTTCVGILVGRIDADGAGFDIARSVSGRRVEIPVRVGIEVRLFGNLWAGLTGLVDLALLRQDLSFGPLGDERPLHDAGVVSLGIAAGLGVSFPAP